jgi:hypothetical protein
MTVREINAVTGVETVRPYTAEELAALPPPPTAEEIEAQRIAAIDAKRIAAYREESDPLFFEWQRGDSTEQAWLDKIAQIKARFPK